MADQMFQIDRREMEHFGKIMNHLPNEFRTAAAGVINSLAFETRRNNVKELSKNMIIRNKGFMNAHLVVDVCRPSSSINNLIAEAGSIKSERFTGWKENEDGTAPHKDRRATLQARDGDITKQMTGPARLKAGVPISKPSQFPGRNPTAKFHAMMRILGSRGGGQFIIDQEDLRLSSGKIMHRGLYSFRAYGKAKGSKGKTLKHFQSFNVKRAPRRVQWMKNSIQYLDTQDLTRLWNEQITRALR